MTSIALGLVALCAAALSTAGSSSGGQATAGGHWADESGAAARPTVGELRLVRAAAAHAAPADTPRYRSGAEDREAIAITVYNQNFGLVREVRDIPLTRGLLDLEFGDVASSIQTETVHIRSLTGGQPL
jgi:hypothetical protein